LTEKPLYGVAAVGANSTYIFCETVPPEGLRVIGPALKGPVELVEIR
jgi:hypothetical protein